MDAHNIVWEERQKGKRIFKFGVFLNTLVFVVIGITDDKAGLWIAALIMATSLLYKVHKEVRIAFMRGNNR